MVSMPYQIKTEPVLLIPTPILTLLNLGVFCQFVKFCQSEIIFILVDYSFVKYPGHSLGKAFEKLHFIKGDTVSQ